MSEEATFIKSALEDKFRTLKAFHRGRISITTGRGAVETIARHRDRSEAHAMPKDTKGVVVGAKRSVNRPKPIVVYQHEAKKKTGGNDGPR